MSSLPHSVRELLIGGSRRQLLSQVSHRLVLLDGELIDLDSGRVEQLTSGEARPSAEEIARATTSILRSSTVTGIALYLSPSEFVSTSIDMQGVSKENLLSALQLQVDNLFPSFDEALSLTLGSHVSDTDINNVALWLPQKRMDELFSELEKNGVFLVAVAPRNLVDTSIPALIDFDSSGGTLVQLNSGTLFKWLHINHVDLKDESLNEQWSLSIDAVSNLAITVSDSASFQQFNSARISSDYAFVPDGALKARKRVEKGRNLALAAAAVLVLMVFAAIPFILQSLEFRGLASNLSSHREQSVQAREDQSVVVNFENEWGPITDFPVQNVQEAMFTLQRILLPDQLASLELSEGLIKIQGTSSEPQAILQRLEQDPLFTEVVFSRATNNSRYYIDLRLSTVNFEGYMVRYFPDE